jgi:hypothetical protein
MVTASMIAAIDQHVAHTGGAHLAEGDFGGVRGSWHPKIEIRTVANDPRAAKAGR